MSKKPDPKSSLHRFWAGALPAAAAVLVLLVQALRPFVVHEQQGLLFTAADWLVSISLAIWVWCVVRETADRFETRDEGADARQELILQQGADNHAEVLRRLGRLANAVQAVHGRIEAAEKSIAADKREREQLTKEIQHLRRLILQGNLVELGNERLGPRPIA